MRMGSNPDFAVIIPACNEGPRLGACIGSVREALGYAEMANAEVIVVDDCSTDDTSEVARAHGAQAIRQSRRLGQMAACSLGVVTSSAPLLSFVDADCQVGKGAFTAIRRGFARPEVGVVAARCEPGAGLVGNSLVERSALFSALMLHETKYRLINHDFLPIGRLFALRRDAWQPGDDQQRPCDRIYASRAKRAGWEIVYAPDAVVYYQVVETYEELRFAYIRSAQTHARARLAGDWAEPLPWMTVCRAGLASARLQPLNAAAWLTLRARLRCEQSVGRARRNERFAGSGIWDRLPTRSRPPGEPGSGPTASAGTSQETR